MRFSAAIEIYDIKVCRCSQLNGQIDSTFSNFFSSNTQGCLKPNSVVGPPWDVGMKICSNSLGHMTKMAYRPIYGKTFKNLLHRNQEADDLEI